ncbi:hypothetical protein O7623_29955 [Solwaraspora sp. WMMD791]|uniref:hypothetical protein n=1 Tax=Solwaraspora sp. WMMD791 TaxID=3016086 RepID=UPI00249B38D3|nr:hypothetical protein [Solwaraspora sp. WMMD791]WFE27399.1 hypothetical protein O7623_29955 [Solwaraspora sp. WMMD791]
MASEMKRLLEQELLGQPAPPLGDLVATSIRQGRRRRRVRRVLATVGGVAAAALATVAALLAPAMLGAIATGPVDEVAAPAAAPPATLAVPAPTRGPATEAPAAPSPTPRPRCGESDPVGLSASLSPRIHVTNCPAPESLDFDVVGPESGVVGPGPDTTFATPTAEDALKLLLGLLPEGRTSDHATSAELWPRSGLSTVALHLDRGDGPGMIRLTISQADPASASRCDAGQLCYTLPDGTAVVIYDLTDDCLAGRGLWVQRPDGIRVELNIARCQPWDGRTNPPTEPALTTQEALTIALNPQWGIWTPTEAVEPGSRMPTGG